MTMHGSDVSTSAATAAAAPRVPLVAYGNLGLPADDKGWAFTEELSPEDYAEHAGRWLALGARIVGGCCGTRAEHTRALRKRLDAAESEPAA
ncbi:MAG: homocysteine S-methyltransferase family protein [Thermoanaerobaculia bacterium]